jgi:antitoxin VapB
MRLEKKNTSLLCKHGSKKAVYTLDIYLRRIYNMYIRFNKEVIMTASTGSVFKNNQTQAVRLPVDARFNESVKRVTVRVVGEDRVLSPVQNTWDSFFMLGEKVSDDFMVERASQAQAERESLDA